MRSFSTDSDLVGKRCGFNCDSEGIFGKIGMDSLLVKETELEILRKV